MASFNVTGDSTACAVSGKLIGITYKYQEGSILYSCAKSRRGILERICIKTVRVVATRKTWGQPVIMYIDTLNTLWNEDELCAEDDAVAAAIDYLENLKNDIQESLENCTIS